MNILSWLFQSVLPVPLFCVDNLFVAFIFPFLRVEVFGGCSYIVGIRYSSFVLLALLFLFKLVYDRKKERIGDFRKLFGRLK